MSNCIMCASYQKFYSALKNLSDFIKAEEFCDVVSSIDSFFSEFRNIIFVLQKSLDSSKNKKIYKQLRDQYLTSDELKWLNDKRAEIIHQNPFKLNKQIMVNVYFYGNSNEIIKHNYTYENWENAKQLENEIKEKLKKFKAPEIYLSIIIRFTENGKEINIIDLIKHGIADMNSFLTQFKLSTNTNCLKCENMELKISEKIKEIYIYELCLERDYEYIPSTNLLEPKSRAKMLGLNNNINKKEEKIPINNNFFQGNNLKDMFKDFISHHILIYKLQKQHIMPTMFIFYKDKTFKINSFLAESKATFYREINTIATQIEREHIIGIFVVWESYVLPTNINFNERYEERVKHLEKTILCFYYIDKSLEEIFTFVNSETIKNDIYKSIKESNFNSTINPHYQLFYSIRYNFAKTYHKYLNLKNFK